MDLGILKYIAKQSLPYIVLLLCISIAAGLLYLAWQQILYDCSYKHAPSYSDIVDKLKINDSGTFESYDGKLIAKSIYNYRSQFIYEYGDNNKYIDVFSIFKPQSPPDVNDLTDMALYKLVTCNALAFSKMVTFSYVFNNPDYFKCIKAFDTTAKIFKPIDGIPDRSPRDVIIKDILKFGDITIADIKQSMNEHIKKLSIDSSISGDMINNVVDTINNMNDEQLFNLINSGLVE